jgi:outer membrane protein OmpA-like peptidoglycan-associated protein/tetratricopeptide (TPR) repeat protein
MYKNYYLLKIGLIAILLCAAYLSDAQMSKGKTLFFKEHYRKALPLFEEIVKEEPENAEALYYAGICHVKNYENQEGLDYIQKAKSMDSEVDKKYQDYWMGVAHHYNYNFDSAKFYYSRYKGSLSGKDQRIEEVNKLISEIQYAKQHLNAKNRFWVEFIDGINTSHAEHSPVISSNGKVLYYTSRNEKVTGEEEADFDGDFYEDIYAVKVKEDGTLGERHSLGLDLNTKHHDATCQIFDNDSKLLIYRWNKGGSLYISTKNKLTGHWGDPKLILPKGVVNTKSYESHGFITDDGNTLYFSSNYKTENKDLDILISKKVDGEWQEPTKLGTNINSSYDEDSPFIMPDGKTMYFSSRGHESMGGYDIFKSEWDEERKEWGVAVHMGLPINTPEEDSYLVWEENGWQGYFTSERKNGAGEKDIYRFGRTYDLIMEGVVASEKDGSRIPNVKLDFGNEQYNIAYNAVTNDTGYYKIEIASDLAFDLGFAIKLPDSKTEPPFFKDTINIPLAKRLNIKIRRDFLVPYDNTTQLLLTGIITERNSGDRINGDLVIRDLETGEEFKRISTNDGSYKVDLEVPKGKKYEIDFYEGGIAYQKVNDFTVPTDGEIKRDVIIDRIENDLLKSEYPKFVKHVYFDFDKAYIRRGSATPLKEAIDILNKYPSKSIRIVGHTDFFGENDYNQNLSQRRASIVYEYLLNQGVSPDRMAITFSGEESPIAKNEVGGKDKPKNRQLNRRVEVIDNDYANVLDGKAGLLYLTFKKGMKGVDGTVSVYDLNTNKLVAQSTTVDGVFTTITSIAKNQNYRVEFSKDGVKTEEILKFLLPDSKVLYREIGVK